MQSLSVDAQIMIIRQEVLLNRIREHIEVRNDGEVKYPMSSFFLNCKGDACKGDVVIFEQNIYKSIDGYICGQRTNASRIIKESYGIAKQQHTFTIEILWSKGYKMWPPLHPLLIKGRNLYKNRTMRPPWPDEEERKRVIQEKHERGCLARKSRAARIHKKEIEKMAILNMMKDNNIKEQQNMSQKRPQEPQQQKLSLRILLGKVYCRKSVIFTINFSMFTLSSPFASNKWQMLSKKNFCFLILSFSHVTRVILLVQCWHTYICCNRVSEIKGPSLQNGEPGNTRKQHIPSNAASTHHNEVLSQKAAIRTFKQEFIDRQVSSIQHGGVQRKILSEPTHTQQVFKDSSKHQSFQQQNDILPQIFSKPTPSMFKYPHQAPKHEDLIEEGGGHPAHQTYRPRNQDQNSACCATEYVDSSRQHQGKFTQHANVFQRGSKPINQDFNSSDQFHGHDFYHQGYHDYRASWHQNYYGHRLMTQDQYHTYQNHHQNYNGHRETNHNQYHWRHNQPHQFSERPRLCRYYYRQGWCPYKEACWYSRDV
ncbi:hypothetical protein BS78_01G237100 [Paspalum vaginatum]|nr:hypothetical protein BS78_01G237100 [Paspalum vaginatum]